VCVGFCHEHALILYVYLNNGLESDGSVLTVSCRDDVSRAPD
jgi:hypothetical protein